MPKKVSNIPAYDYKAMTDYELKSLMKKCRRQFAGTSPTAFFLMSPAFQQPYENWTKVYDKCEEELERRKNV